MSLDNSTEKQQNNEKIESKNDVFRFEFGKDEKSKPDDDEYSFSIGISNNSNHFQNRKKKDKIISPGKKKLPDFVRIDSLRELFNSINTENDIKSQFGVRQPAGAQIDKNDRDNKDIEFVNSDINDTNNDYTKRFAGQVRDYAFRNSNIDNLEVDSTEFEAGIEPDFTIDSDDDGDISNIEDKFRSQSLFNETDTSNINLSPSKDIFRFKLSKSKESDDESEVYSCI
jgi:hypothetical protein